MECPPSSPAFMWFMNLRDENPYRKKRQETPKKSWDLKQLRHEGMKMESAATGSSDIAEENNVHKVWNWMKRKTDRDNKKYIDSKKITCC